MTSQAQLANYVLGSLTWSGLAKPGKDAEINKVLALYCDVLALGHFHLPFYLIHDLWGILTMRSETPFASDFNMDSWADGERAIRLRYEREVLNRTLQAPKVMEVLDTINDSRDSIGRLGRLIAIIASRLAPLYPKTMEVNPAIARRINWDVDDDLDARHEAIRLESGESPFQAPLLEFLDNLAAKMRWNRLLQEEDVFEITHWDRIPTEHLRIGCRQLIEVERRLGEVEAQRVTIPEEDADADTAFIDETHYPVGGIAELTNKGSIENLVSSELAYIEEGEGINLFDLRFLENELLFYMRDSGALRRRRRTVHVVFDLDEVFQIKSPGHEYQFSILTQGLALRVVLDLFQVFEHDSVNARFIYKGAADDKFLLGEQNLMSLLLDDAVKHDWVSFDQREEIELADLKETKRKPYVLVFAGRSYHTWREELEAARFDSPPTQGAVVQVAPPSDRDAGTDNLFLNAKGAAWEELVELKESILLKILGART